MLQTILSNIYFASWLLATPIFSQGSQGSQFITPDGTESFILTDEINISWRAGWFGTGQQPERVDLFVESLFQNFGSDSYSQLLLGKSASCRTTKVSP
jgi:hypothetical protein